MAVQLRLPARQLEESLASPPREQARERGMRTKAACADALIARRHPHYSRTLWCEDASNRVAEQPRSELLAARETRKQKALPSSATQRTRILEPLRNARRVRSPTALRRSCLPATAESHLASSCLDCSVREAVGERCDCE
jgi:hypothetical protein